MLARWTRAIAPLKAVGQTLVLTIATLSVVTPAAGQSLQVAVTAGGAVTNVSAGSAVPLSAVDIGLPVLATVTVRNSGVASVPVTGVSISGSSEMTLALATGFPVNLSPNASLSFGLQYLPSTGNAVSAQVTIGFNPSGQPGTFAFAVTGTSPRLAYGYSLSSGAPADLNPGDRINFPATNIGTSSAAVVNVTNRGSATVLLQSVTVSGPAFQLSGAQGPFQLPPGTQVSITVIFSPQSAGGSQSLLVITRTGSNISFSLAGVGTAASLAVTYTFADGNVHPFVDGADIAFPAIDANATSTSAVEVLNQGTGSGMVNGISLSGDGFRLSGVPLLPATVAAGQSLRFGIIFAPSRAGTFSANFRIDLSGRTISGTVRGSTTTADFSVSYATADNVDNRLTDGATISFPPVDVGRTATATVDMTNQGSGPGAVTAILVAGSGFRATGVPSLPANVGVGQTLRFTIIFAPTVAGSYSGTFRIDLAGRTVSGRLSASTAAPDISLAYIEPDTNNILPLRDGSTLVFPNTVAALSSSITLLATNSGAGTGTVDSIVLNAPAAFQLLSIPILPASVPPSQQLRFGVRFSPLQQQSFSGTLVISLNGRALNVKLQAQGTGPQFTYAYGTSAVPVLPNGTIALGETGVGQTRSLLVSVTNVGNAEGQITAIAVTGAGFSLSELPPVPFTVQAGSAVTFTVTFAPSQPGAVTGRLTIGSSLFTLTATGVGSRLIYWYMTSAPEVAVAESGVVVFPPVEVGKAGRIQFGIQNIGTGPATISSISLAVAGAAFALEQLPFLPFNLDPGATSAFGISFSPGTTGSLSATLRVNVASFTLSGTGTQPPALPSYAFETPTGALQPAQQPAIGLTLASPYSLPIEGALTLTFLSNVFADDPSIQFAAGGRTVKFTIPANSTKALFHDSPLIALQTGTTAGTIVITPTFALRGGFDMTPPAVDPFVIPIPRVAPHLLNASITSQTATGFTLVLNGYSTTRAVRQLEVLFTPKQGETFSTSRITIDVTSASAGWYQSAASQGSGGSFLAAIPFTLQGGGNSGDLVRRLQLLNVTAYNDVGVSAALPVPIP